MSGFSTVWIFIGSEYNMKNNIEEEAVQDSKTTYEFCEDLDNLWELSFLEPLSQRYLVTTGRRGILRSDKEEKSVCWPWRSFR